VKRLAILGSTGSVGTSTLDVVARFPDRFRVVALAAGKNDALLAEQVRAFRPALVAVADPEAAMRLKARLRDVPVRIVPGPDALTEAASVPDADVVVSATAGTAGLEATLAAIAVGRVVALANKESLVAAGELLLRRARECGATIVPVDSEHSALFQCLIGRTEGEVRGVVLTASGGPLTDRSAEELAQVTPADALAHPTWRMGPKVTIDSATLMNKGLEVIEAHWLFGFPAERIGVLVHPESVVHGLVELRDGQMLAHLGVPDMKGPIAYALSYPDRPTDVVPRLDLARLGRLTFREPDPARFPALGLAYQALAAGGTAPAVLAAADEVAVAAFLRGAIGFSRIAAVIAAVLESAPVAAADSLAAVREAERTAREIAEARVRALRS
jgi:1-deoxy-D-xylulose-5-phosphate reductoisomerase